MLLDTHLEQISLCAAAISELSFAPARIFTNALLHPHDITALIRDTESHERALFSVPPPAPPPSAQDPTTSSTRRNTVFKVKGNNNTVGGGGSNAVRASRRNTAVSAILGGDMVEQIRKGGGGGVGTGMGYAGMESKDRGEVEVDVLLKGVEKLCGVYAIPGVSEKITALYARNNQLTSSIAHYEARVTRQAIQLEQMNRPRQIGGEEEEEDFDDHDDDPNILIAAVIKGDTEITDEDLRKEEEEIQELERKKQGLEDRVSGMERDLGGLLR
ncbi:MAG: hypothetical protein M1835_004399 [Candelina submexicana]|nr:MAG: hypothetical protein M1835_004399 [Candelina submexicana]